MPKPDHSPNIGELVQLLLALERDEQRPAAERAARDRVFRAELGPELTEIQRLGRWLQRFDPDGAQVRGDTDGALSGATSMVVTIGIVFGLLAATGALYYDGTGRVNVLVILGLLIGLPLLLMALSWIAVLAGSSMGSIPLLGDILRIIGKGAPGRWMPTLSRVLGPDRQRALEALLGLRMHDEVGVASVRAWLIARWSHAGGIGFFLGGLAMFLALVLFTDLAFGWSTTLSLSTVTLEGLTRTLAIPWSWVFADAVPSSELIEATRYYRSEGMRAPPPQPAMLGLWWSFLVLAMLVYGFVPRLLSFVIAGSLLKRSVRQAYLAHPQTRTLLERLTPPRVESQGAVTRDATSPAAHVEMDTVWPPASPGQTLINWSNVPLDDQILLHSTEGKSVLPAGGSRPLIEDQLLLDEFSRKRDAPVLVICKAWEPPVLDLQDFLDALDKVSPHGVEVMPISIDAGLPAVPTARDHEVWQRAFVASKQHLVSPPESRT